VAALAALAFCGCRSLPPQPPIDFSGPGWTLREGQAVWRPRADADGIAGDLLVATHADGRSVVQFTKTPLPFIVAQRTAGGWQFQFIPRNKTYSGRGSPPARLLWLHLADGFEGFYDPSKFGGSAEPDGSFSFWNLASGERLEGFLNMTRRPSIYVVKSGDSFMRIARHHDITLDSLRDANPGIVVGRLRVGQRLMIPPLAPKP
jgi:hypothetical protein